MARKEKEINLIPSFLFTANDELPFKSTEAGVEVD